MSKFRVGITADVLSSDGEPIFGREVLGLLDADGISWEYMAQAPDGLTPAQAARYDAVCAMLTRVTPASLAGPDRRLKLIARFGVGYDTIDVPACTAAGVLLTIAPDGVRRPVATSALTFVLMLAQKVLIKDRLTRAGRWSEKLDHIGTGLTGRTLGSIGLGNIGAELFRIARPLEMNGIAHDPVADPALAAQLGVRLVDLETLFRESDFLAVNCPLNDATRGLVNARLLGADEAERLSDQHRARPDRRRARAARCAGQRPARRCRPRRLRGRAYASVEPAAAARQRHRHAARHLLHRRMHAPPGGERLSRRARRCWRPHAALRRQPAGHGQARVSAWLEHARSSAMRAGGAARALTCTPVRTPLRDLSGGTHRLG